MEVSGCPNAPAPGTWLYSPGDMWRRNSFDEGLYKLAIRPNLTTRPGAGKLVRTTTTIPMPRPTS
eukprot:7805018-Karenia_brevis.AAC.1